MGRHVRNHGNLHGIMKGGQAMGCGVGVSEKRCGGALSLLPRLAQGVAGAQSLKASMHL